MPTIITHASKELPVQCGSEEILWKEKQSSQYQCNVYRMSLYLHCSHRCIAACSLTWCWACIGGAWMSHFSGDVGGEVHTGL